MKMTRQTARTVDWVLAWTLWALRRGYRSRAVVGMANILRSARAGGTTGMPKGAPWPRD